MSNQEGTRRNHLSQGDTYKLGKMLEKVCVSIDGAASYEDGWSDIRVAEEFQKTGAICTPHNVAGLRNSIFGGLRKMPSPSLEALQERLAQLEKWASSRPVAPFKRI